MALGPLAGLASAATWGAGDFAGGMAARRLHVFHVVFYSQLLGFLALLAVSLGLGEKLPATSDLIWAGAAGIAGGVGVSALYASLASGRMGIAAPITGVVAALLPVTYAWLVVEAPSLYGFGGVALALVGIVLVSGPRAERPPTRVLLLAVVSGLGFAGFLLLMGLSNADSFLWTLTAARAASTGALLIIILAMRRRLGRLNTWTVGAGVGDVAGNALFLVAARAGRLDVAVVLSSLYPIATVVLARWVLKERLTALQSWGAALMLAAIPLVALA